MSGLSIIGSRPSSDTDPLGLQMVNDPPNPTADLIFIHGLGGSAFRTWSWQRNTENFWPRWLAHDEQLKSCRVFAFGYDANFKGEARGLDVLDFAKDLLLQMLNYPDGLGRSGPILFVVHSMGGLVAKKAYTLGKHDKRFAALISNVMGIIFLATPHRGSQYAKTLTNILAAAPIQAPPKSYITALQLQSPAIQDINEVFGHQCEGLVLVSFYETHPVKIGFTKLIIVEKDSAVLGYGNEMSASMSADHNTITKFESEKDPNYIKLKDTLRNILPKNQPHGSKKIAADTAREIHEVLGVFDFAKSDTHKRRAPRDSGTWLLHEKGFASWLAASKTASDPRFYWLFGLPGSGKTVLSTIIIDQLQLRDHNPQFHFFTEAHQTKRTIAYGLRSIATQLALEDASFRSALLSFQRETGLFFNNQNQNFHSVWEKIFEGIVFQLTFSRPLIWVLDGIDESDAPDTLLSHLAQIRSRTPIKIFFSSRPLKAISRFESSHIRSYFLREGDTAEDMRRYAANIVQQALPDDEELLRDIVSQTMKISSGSFLWVKLALEALEENWHTQEDIRTVLTQFPSGMVPMYNRMVSKIESQLPRSRDMARRILTWATCSWRPLRLEELQTALEPEFRNFINLEDTVMQICGHFITITPVAISSKQISLIHKTARDFLSKEDHGNAKPSFINLQDGHRHLAVVCLRYLSSEHWRRHFDTILVGTQSLTFSSKTPNRLVLAENGYPLLGYAACYWAYHVSKAPVDASELLQALKLFFTRYLLSWLEAICLSGNLQYLMRSAQFLKGYVRRQLRAQKDRPLSLAQPPEHDVEWIQSWATDIIRVVGKFGSVLIHDPPSVYRQLPVFCPRNSMIGRTYAPSRQDSLRVTGLKTEEWDDCLASVNVGRDEYATQVSATEICFVTLVSTTGSIIVWSSETCEQLRTINVGSYVPLMAINRAGTAIATVTFDSYDVWDLLTGRRLYHCLRPSDALVLDLRFGTADWELVMGLNSNSVLRLNVSTGLCNEFHIELPADADFSYQGCPWRMALSPDLTKIAVAWRGRPPLIWDLLPTGPAARPRKCHFTLPSDSICAPEMLRWHPDAEVLFILCQDMKVVQWRVFDGEQKEWSHLNAREMAVSDDGNSLLSSDNTGTLSVWNFPRLNLVYRLINESDLSSGMTFSPGGQRFYDIRGSICNVWEPEALVRADEHDLEERSSVGGTTILTEPTISHFDAGGQLVTALALDVLDRYYCCGKEDGKVWIHDAVSGKRLRKVYNHWASSTVIALSWSTSGKYMVSCDDGAFVIAKRLQVKEEGVWGVFPVFDRRLEEPVSQFLFSTGEQFLLISTPTTDHVWDLKAKKEVATRHWDGRQSRRWIQHPTEKDVLICINTSEVRCHQWPTLESLGEPAGSESTLSVPSTSSLHRHSRSRSGLDDHGTYDRCVFWTAIPADRRSVVYASLPSEGSPNTSCLSHSNLHIESVDAASVLQDSRDDNSTRRRCLPGVAEQIKHLLGMCKTSIVFLDHDCWVCTWNMQDETGQVMRHFFIPKDWVNTSTSHMAMVNIHGTFYCPRYSDVGIVRNGIRI